MKKRKPLFQLYADSNRASNLSIAGGAVRVFSILILAAAVLCTLVLLLPGFRIASVGGIGTGLLFIMDELTGIVVGAFLLWAVFAGCRYTAKVLQAKADLIAPMPEVAPREVTSPEAAPVQQKEEPTVNKERVPEPEQEPEQDTDEKA